MAEDSRAAAAPPGLDLDRLRLWLAAAVPAASAVTHAELITGGKSNLTYVVSDGESRWVVRRPPLGHVLATAHDMGREYRAMSALSSTAVPVPHTYALCEDETVLGAQFYVMEFVAGSTYRFAADLAPLGAGRVRSISTALIDTLSELHRVDPVSVGLADFGRPEGFLPRQVARWKKQFDASLTRDRPAADELFAQLSSDIPAQGPPGIVHGDFRLDNTIIDAEDAVAAVLDWEMATLGDPLTDLALLIVYGRLGELEANTISDVTTVAGYLPESAMITRYSGTSGRDLSRLGWYIALASYKLAAILEGINFRHQRGQTVGDGFGGVDPLIEPLLASGLQSIDA